MIAYVWLIPCIMLLAALVNGLGVRRLGRYAGHVSWVAMALCFVISLGVLAEVFRAAGAENHWKGETIVLWSWMEIHNFFGPDRTMSIDMAFRVDQLTAVYLCFVSLIGTLVFIYATGYMKERHGEGWELDPGYARFFSYVALFAAMMFILVLGANLAVMFIGWEGVGLCSYLLIGYFFDKPFSENLSCADAGRKAFIVNRIGDAGLIVGMGLIFWGLGTVDFLEIEQVLLSGKLLDGITSIHPGFLAGGALITAATLAMFLGATGKSAQIPLFVWLPDAMAGPTPVSALIHAATMVTAGVYMVARLNVAYFFSPTTLAVIAIVGALTAIVAAFAGLAQRGIKKALAYSTVSQLGYMFLALGSGAMAYGIFHVFTHAFFKGCLFLCAGAVIHAMHHEEDMFKMGGLRKYMPKTWLAYLLATLAIAGVPPFAGFFSKDEVLFSAYLAAGDGVPILWGIGIVTAVLTAVYMGRTLILTFHGKPRMDDHTREHLHEAPANMWMPVMVLAGFSVVVGFLNVPSAFGGGAHFHHFLAPVVDRGAEHIAGIAVDHAAGDSIYGPLVLAGAADPMKADYGVARGLAIGSALLAIGGLLMAVFLYGSGLERGAKLKAKLKPLWSVSFNAWFWDDFYNAVFKDGSMLAARGVWRADVKIIDGAVNGLGQVCQAAGTRLRRLQNGQVQTYGLVMFAGVLIFVVYFAIGISRSITPAAEREPVPVEEVQTGFAPGGSGAVDVADAARAENE